MKKTLAFIMALSMSVCALASCGESGDDSSKKSASSSYDDDDANYSGSNKDKKQKGSDTSEDDTEPSTEKPADAADYDTVIRDFERAVNWQDGEGMMRCFMPSDVIKAMKTEYGSEWEELINEVEDQFVEGFTSTAGEDIAPDFEIAIDIEDAERISDLSSFQDFMDELSSELDSKEYTVTDAYALDVKVKVTNNGEVEESSDVLNVMCVDGQWLIDIESLGSGSDDDVIFTEPVTEVTTATEPATSAPAVIDSSYEDVIMDFQDAINYQDGEGMLNAMFPSFIMSGLKEQLGDQWEEYINMVSEGFEQGFTGSAGEDIASDFNVILTPKSATEYSDLKRLQNTVDEYCSGLSITETHTVTAAYKVKTNVSVTNNGKSNERDVDLVVYCVDNEWYIDTESMS